MDFEIHGRIVEILCNKFQVDKDLLTEKNGDEPLTGRVFRLTGEQLTYIFLEIEKAFSIHIDENHLFSYGFCTINGIVRIVQTSLSHFEA